MPHISVNLWASRKEIFANLDKYCGYNEYTNNLVPVKRLRTPESNRADEWAA
jgi:hypothetical protein